MTTMIVLNALFALIAVCALVFLKRVAYKTGLGHFDTPEIFRLRNKEPEVLPRAA